MSAAPLVCGTCGRPIGERKAYIKHDDGGIYHPGCVPTEASRLRAFVTDLFDSGVRFDICPKTTLRPGQTLSQFYVEYINRIDASIRERAKAALDSCAPRQAFNVIPVPSPGFEEEWDCIDCEHSRSAHCEQKDGHVVCNADEEIGVDCECGAYLHPADDPEVNWVCLRCDQQFNDYTAAMHDCIKPGLTGPADE